ncbi:unnamed protein product [Pieris macdunnoughi]|uniref:Uncharacterized protein n=1 Tax=Pieris macdunnoughi TaxID=345717 RepID=A0A821WV41_9NEOP|nr:unnamed protein product [Pieris macdunnoughi]
MLNEQDLMVARALAAESRDSSPGGSPGPLRKNPLNNIADKLNTFRSESELSTLRMCKSVERSEYRFKRKPSKSLIPQALLHAEPQPQLRHHRQRRSGTWP